MIGWDTDVLEPPIRESATGDMLCLSKAATTGGHFYVSSAAERKCKLRMRNKKAIKSRMKRGKNREKRASDRASLETRRITRRGEA